MALLALALALATPAEVRQAKRGIVAVFTQENGELDFVCSGFATGVRLVVTAAHCVRPKTTVIVGTQEGRMYPARVISRRYDAASDQALLSLDTQDYLQPLYKCKNWPEVGDPLWVWGSPRGVMPVLRTGIYSGPLRFWANPMMEKVLGMAFLSSINVDGGSSGSPVLTEQGCYIGIVSMMFRPEIKLDGAIFKKVF